MEPRDPPRHVIEGLIQGTSELTSTLWYGMHAAVKQPLWYAAREGLMGATKGVVYGVLSLTESVVDGVLDMSTYVVEGVRNTPDALADHVLGEDRPCYRHCVDRHEGRVLETFLQEQPKHISDGFLKGTKAVGNGLIDGTSSLIMKNVEAVDSCRYVSNLPAALSRGLLQGSVAFTAKTGASGLDFTEAVVDGLRNTPDYLRCEVLPHVDLDCMKLTTYGVDSIVTAAQRAAEIEKRITAQAGSAWEHRSKPSLAPVGANKGRNSGAGAPQPQMEGQHGGRPPAGLPADGAWGPCGRSPAEAAQAAPRPIGMPQPAQTSGAASMPRAAAALPGPELMSVQFPERQQRRHSDALSDVTRTSQDRASLPEMAGYAPDPAYGDVFPVPWRVPEPMAPNAAPYPASYTAGSAPRQLLRGNTFHGTAQHYG